MKTLILIFLFFSHIAAASDLWLKVGEVHHLRAPAESTIRVGSGKVMKAIDSGNGIDVVALKPGVSVLMIGSRSYRVHVGLSNQKSFAVAMQKTIGKMMGLHLSTDSSDLVVTGTLLRFSDWQTLADLAREHQGRYEFRAYALPDVAEKAIDFFHRLAKGRGFPVVRFSAAPDFTIRIPKASDDLKESVQDAFQPYGIRIASSDADLALAPLVRTRVILAEVSKSFSRQLGIQWPSQYEAHLVPKFQGDDKSLMATLQALEARGQAQILASPNLICKSGGSAQFHAGGELPIQMKSRYRQEVEWRKHGVLLSVKPKADFQGSISLQIQTEISLLDMAHVVDGIPSIKDTSVSSHFDLPGKRTIALSGLIQNQLGQSAEGLPFLTGIPILGRLFASRQFQQNQTELVIFVTPEIYVPDHDEKIEMPEGWIRHGFEP